MFYAVHGSYTIIRVIFSNALRFLNIQLTTMTAATAEVVCSKEFVPNVLSNYLAQMSGTKILTGENPYTIH